jgi:hypothetical protein
VPITAAVVANEPFAEDKSMNKTELESAADRDGFSAALDERQDEHIGTVASEQHGSADYEDFEEVDQGGFADPDDQPLTAEEREQVGRELAFLFGKQDRRDGVSVQAAAGPGSQTGADAGIEGEGDDDVVTRSTECPGPKVNTAECTDGGTTGVIGATGRSSAATHDDTTGSSSDAAESAAGNDDSGDGGEGKQPATALARPQILTFGPGELIPAEIHPGKVDVDKFASFWFGAYDDEDYLVIEARLVDQGEYIACLNGKNKLLTDPLLLARAEQIGIPIKYRIYKNLTEAESRAFVLDSQDGGRPLTPKQRRELRHAKVLTLLEIRAGSDTRLTFAEIGRRGGYTEARVRQIHKEHQRARDRNISDSESREAPATMSKSGAPPKKPKEKKLVAGVTEPASTAPQAFDQVAGFDATKVAIDRLDIPPEKAGILTEESKEAGVRRFKDFLAGNQGGDREEILLTFRAIVEFESAQVTALDHLEGLLAARKEGAA